MYAVLLIYRGALRRRIRRLVRSRLFNNARTATRNLDLPLAMEGPHLTHKPVYCIGGFRPVYGGNTGGLFCIRRSTGRVVIRSIDSAAIFHVGRKS
jgi:hypothetical protein